MKTDNNNLSVNARFTFDKVRYDKENELHLVLELKAPKKDWEKSRPPVCVFPVIDISGSMTGGKLDYAKKSAIKLIDHLQEGDYAGLAVFDNEAQLISSPLEMNAENKKKLRQRVGDLGTRGSTDFCGGMLLGLGQLNSADLPKDLLLRVIMLTDGQANCGLATDFEGLSKLLNENIGRATMSCFGYGEGANQELLSNLARLGKGNYAFIQNPDDALSAFAKELGGLLSTYGKNLEIKVSSENGHTLSEVVSDADVTGDDKALTIKLPEIISEEKIDLVLAVKLSKQSKALPRALNAFSVDVSYDVVLDSGKVENKTESLKAKISFVKAGNEQDKPTKEVDEIVALAQIIKAQIESEKLAESGDYLGASQLMQKVAGVVRTKGLIAHADFAIRLGDTVSSNRAYLSSDSYRSTTKNVARRRYGTSSTNKEAYEDISCFVGNINTEAQDKMVEDFTAGQHTLPVVISTPAPVATPAPIKTEPKTISKSRSKRW